MAAIEVEPGRERGVQDGSRRFTPHVVHFDTRASLLATTIEGDWEPAVQQQWRENHQRVRETLIHEHGVSNYEQKVENLAELGAAPWSVVALHNIYLAQVRSSFVSTHYYPALLGACGLGERVLNQLVLMLREDYADHDATKRVRAKQSFDNWQTCIDTLHRWGVFTEDIKRDYGVLMRMRHAAVHYRSSLDDGDARSEALKALRLLSGLIEAVFSPIGERPYYFMGPITRSYVRRESEADPFVKRFILPACVLVSPIYRFVPAGGTLVVYDDPDYGSQSPDLSDDAFAAAGQWPQVLYPF